VFAKEKELALALVKVAELTSQLEKLRAACSAEDEKVDTSGSFRRMVQLGILRDDVSIVTFLFYLIIFLNTNYNTSFFCGDLLEEGLYTYLISLSFSIFPGSLPSYLMFSYSHSNKLLKGTV